MRSFLRKARSSQTTTKVNNIICDSVGSNRKIMNLKIDSDSVEKEFSTRKGKGDIPDTPATVDTADDEQSSLEGTPRASSEIRGNGDVRSPGMLATPMALPRHDTAATEVDDDEEDDEQLPLKGLPQDAPAAPLPDFITQTDKDGRSLSQAPPPTERSTALVKKEETFMDSIRVMCCCLLLDENNNDVSQKLTTQSGNFKAHLIEADGQSSDVEYMYHLPPANTNKKCLVLDLDETLVHSSFRAVPSADFILPVQVDNVLHSVYVAKRPGVDEFLKKMARHYEIVVYTASLNKYADPLLDLLDPTKECISHRLFREHCAYFEGHYVKDLNTLNRPLQSTIIVDNSPNSYLFHPENAIDCTSFIDDMSDRELDQIAEFLISVNQVEDVRHFCPMWRDGPEIFQNDEDSHIKLDSEGHVTLSLDIGDDYDDVMSDGKKGSDVLAADVY